MPTFAAKIEVNPTGSSPFATDQQRVLAARTVTEAEIIGWRELLGA